VVVAAVVIITGNIVCVAEYIFSGVYASYNWYNHKINLHPCGNVKCYIILYDIWHLYVNFWL
jgi:hypothetical protein